MRADVSSATCHQNAHNRRPLFELKILMAPFPGRAVGTGTSANILRGSTLASCRVTPAEVMI